jgi:hypothetical protein
LFLRISIWRITVGHECPNLINQTPSDVPHDNIVDKTNAARDMAIEGRYWGLHSALQV